MKTVYCSNCGKRLNVKRMALKKFKRIINVVEYHECSETPVEFDLTPIDVPTFVEHTEKNKFIQNLNELDKPKTFNIEKSENKEPKSVQTIAPQSLLSQFKSLTNTNPSHDIDDLGGD